MRDAAYGTLLRGKRKELHIRITSTLERGFPEIVETQPDVLAQHCAEAGLAEKAVGYWLKAGQRAVARGAMTEAVAQLRKGLDLLSGVADGNAREEQELDLQIALGHGQLATKGYSVPEPGEGIRSCTPALRATKPICATGLRSPGAVCLSPRKRGVGASAASCRGDTSPR